MAKTIVKFAPRGEENFYDEVKQKVEAYFQNNKLQTHGNRKMIIKTVCMIALYVVPYAFIVSGALSSSLFLFYGAWFLMGLGLIGFGVAVMHDSNHSSYSANKNVNKFLAGIIDWMGASSANWRIQHNILHHTYTNISGLDEDIEGGKLLRLSPNKPLKKFHRFQHLYAWPVYCIMTLYWVTVKDYLQFIRYEKEGLLKKEKLTLSKALWQLTFYKVIYIAYIIVLPILFSGFAWYHVLGGFVVLHAVAGLLMGCIFQPAHVIEGSDFAKPSDERKMENSWAVHQVLNTTNFCPTSTITSWFIGGLNYQIEHHLFPQVCHVHYPKISKIVQETAEEHGLPYNVEPTFLSAIWKHGIMLKKLGSA